MKYPFLCIFFTLLLAPLCSAFAVEKDQQLLMDLRRTLMPDKIETLLAGEREVALLINESTTPITKGVAVLLGETGYSPLSQRGLAPLTNLLNQYGWVTMTMPAPSTGFFESESDEPATPAPDSAPPEQAEIHPKQGLPGISQQAFDRHQQQLMLQLQAVVARTREYPGFFLVIAQGTTAAWLSKLYSEKTLESPDALVVVSPYWPSRVHNNQLPEIIAKTEFPVLDIYSPWDNEWSLKTFEKREIAAVKGLKLHYRQRELIGQVIDSEQYQLLAKEIYGWLSHMGW